MDNTAQGMILWVLMILFSPILVNIIMIWQDNMGFSDFSQAVVGCSWLAFMGVVLWRNRA